VTQRRPLHLETIDELVAEVDRLAAAEAAGTVRRLGNWSPAQAFQHLGRFIEFSFDGFPFRYPWPMRLVCRILRLISWRWLVALALRPGFKNPPAAAAVEPDPSVPLETATAYLRGQLERIRRGERMTQPSPAEGWVLHEQWVYAHLRHAELHLSFLE
jgi:hypothetical protein